MDKVIKVGMCLHEENYILEMTFREFLGFFDDSIFWYIRQDGNMWQIPTGYVSGLWEI